MTPPVIHGVLKSGGRQVATGGSEKDKLILQLTYAKDEIKLPLYLILKVEHPKKELNNGEELLHMK
eukprot:3013323-Ditylum_brightwellii.AAC.1